MYDKNYGYYSKNNPLGKNGDFVTAPLISPLFSEMIFIWVISYWIKIGKPNKFSFVELGPGDGSFCKTFCRILKRFSEFEKSIKIYLFEKSEKLIGTQKKNIKSKNVVWIKNLNEIKNGPILFLVMSFLTLSQLNNLYLKKAII